MLVEDSDFGNFDAIKNSLLEVADSNGAKRVAVKNNKDFYTVNNTKLEKVKAFFHASDSSPSNVIRGLDANIKVLKEISKLKKTEDKDEAEKIEEKNTEELLKIQKVINRIFYEAHQLERRIDLLDEVLDFENWMGRNRQYIEEKNIKDIFLPGSHGSAAIRKINFKNYIPFPHPTIKQRFFSLGNTLSKIFPCFGNFLDDETVTQDDTLYEQAMKGYRFFDIRVSLKKKNEEEGQHPFLATHTYSFDYLQIVIDDILRFINEHPTEIVVLSFTPDFEHKEDMTEEHGTLLITQIKNTFGELLSKRTEGDIFDETMTYNKMIERDERVLVFYSGKLKTTETHIWDGNNVISNWKDTSDPTVKEKFLKKTIQRMHPSNKKYEILDMTLTEQVEDVAINFFGRPFIRRTNKDLAHEIKREIPTFFEGNLPYMGKMSTVTVDFADKYSANYIIELNLRPDEIGKEVYNDDEKRNESDIEMKG